jgi:hypothetical protein
MAIKETIPFNFDDNYAYIANKFAEKGYDIEEGSNTMQLVTAMSYLISMLNANCAVNINETLLTQARKRTMVLEDARILGYEIEHTQSYIYKFSLNFNEIGNFSIKRYTSFLSGDYIYYYMGQEIEEFPIIAGDLVDKHYYCNEITQAQSIVLAADLISTYGDDFGTSWNSSFGWAEFDDNLDTLGNVEISNVIPEADISGSLNNKYWLLSSPTTDYYIWYNVNSSGTDPAIAGKTGIEVAVATDDLGSSVALATKLAIDAVIDFDASISTGTAESISITAEANVSSSLDGKYFLISQPSGGYYVWFDCTGSTADPALADLTGIKITLTTDDTDQTVSDLIVTAVDAITGFGASNVSGTSPTITIVNDDVGSVSDAGEGTTGWVIPTINVQGVDRVVTISNADVGVVTTLTDGNTLWSSGFTVSQVGTVFADEFIADALNNINATLKQYIGIVIQIEVYEGILHKYSNNLDTLTHIIESEITIDENGNEITTVPYYVDVPFTNVEEHGLNVFLTYIDQAGNQHEKEEWERSNSFMIDSDTELIKQFVRLDNIEFKTPRIYFKLGEVGNELRVGTLIYINVLVSSGINGAITTDPVPNSLNADIMEYSLSIAGAEEEATESIRQNAPLFHNTANRVITKPDYIAFCNRQATVKYSDVWDGHYEYPQVSGYIWFSFYPATVVRTLLPINTATNAQYLMDLLDDRSNWYMEDTGETNEIQDIFDYLSNFQIPTLIFQHRQPVYMNFNYEIEIIKYSAGLTNKEQHTTVFNVVNNYFTGSTVETGVETFKFEYFNSNLTKRIDTALTDITGLNISLTTTLELTEKNINTEKETAVPDVFYQEIRAHLGMPYEDVIDENGDITTDNLPNITTTNFIGSDTLSVDYGSGVVSAITGSTQLTTYDILLGVTKIGEYRVFDTLDPDIELIFYVNSTGGYTTGIDLVDLTNTLQISVVYPTPNMRFSRNTIPRLKSVNFI